MAKRATFVDDGRTTNGRRTPCDCIGSLGDEVVMKLHRYLNYARLSLAHVEGIWVDA